MRRYLSAAIVCVLFSGVLAKAELVQYALSVDDYGKMTLDGQQLLLIDTPAQSSKKTAILDLSPGWHNIEIVYKNRWGSNTIAFYQMTGPARDIYTIVPKEDMRSLDGQGQLVSGLKADYFDLSGNYVSTAYGEGPIDHGWSAIAPLNTRYEGVPNTLWAGTYNGWGRFEERLSGQINVVPLPGAVLLGFLGLGTAGIKLRRLA